MAQPQNTHPNIPSQNVIETNYRTDLVALRAQEMAGYFTVGSKAYIPDGELVGKRNGQTYGFTIVGHAEVENSLAVDANADHTVKERTVNLSIEPWHVMVKTNAVEGKTDLQFDTEVATPNGDALIAGALKKAIKNDIVKSSVAFVGKVGEFEPLSMAAGYLNSITSEPLYAFVDPMVEAIVTSKGAQFVPVNAPDMYKQGLIGHFHGADYRGQRFLKQLRISKVLADAMEGAKVASFNPTTNTLTITLGSNAASATKVKANTPFFVDGIVACDLNGEETAQPYAFIATEDVDVASGASTIAIKVDEIPVSDLGNRVACGEDGEIIDWTNLGTPDVACPADGVYFLGVMRANGVYQFQTLNDIDVHGTDYTKGQVERITVHTNKRIDMDKFVNDTRIDLFTLSGVVEKRGQALILVKAK